MDINQNQKAVNPSLRLTLEEDLYWDSDRADSRLKALRSSIVQELADSINGPLYNKISVGEDRSLLTFQPFVTALQKSGLLPIAKGNKYDPNSDTSSFYDIHNQSHREEMKKTKNNLVKFLNLCYGYIEENHTEYFQEGSFILSNRGSFSFICLLGSLIFHETVKKGSLNLQSSPLEKFEELQKYIDSLIEQLKAMSNKERDSLLNKYGTGADIWWLRTFQLLINKAFPDFEPVELIEWKERLDKELQAEGRSFGVKIEKYMKLHVLDVIQKLFGENWQLEINSIKRKCLERAEAEMEKNYKEGLGKTQIEWTEMFTINDYKTIIEKYWVKKPENPIDNFKTFESIFSIDTGEGIGSKAKGMKWISRFNSLRNSWAHEGTKEKGLSKIEVEFLKIIHSKFYSNG